MMTTLLLSIFSAGALILAPVAAAAAPPAVAQVGPQTEDPSAVKVTKYRALMGLNGTAPNVLSILNSTKPAIISYL